MAVKIRLFKIASEINIGKETIVEYLQQKGFSIENKPTAVLTEEMLDVVYDKFKKEKKAAEVQRDKLQKHKDVVKSTTKEAEEVVKSSEKPALNLSSSIIEERIEAAKKTIVDENPKEETRENIDKPITGLNVVGKIDLPEKKDVEITPISSHRVVRPKTQSEGNKPTKYAEDKKVKSESPRIKPKSTTFKKDSDFGLQLKGKIAESADFVISPESKESIKKDKPHKPEIKQVELSADPVDDIKEADKNETTPVFLHAETKSSQEKESLKEVKIAGKEIAVTDDIAAKVRENTTELKEITISHKVIDSEQEKEKVQTKSEGIGELPASIGNDENQATSTNDDLTEDSDDEPKKKKKRKKIVEVNPFEKIELKGLTIVGKIDLNAGKKVRQTGRDTGNRPTQRDFQNRGEGRSQNNPPREFGDRRDLRDRQPQDKGNLTIGKRDRDSGRTYENTGRPTERRHRQPSGEGFNRPNENRPNREGQREGREFTPRDNRENRDGRQQGQRPYREGGFNPSNRSDGRDTGAVREPRDNRNFGGDTRPGFKSDKNFSERAPRDRAASLPFQNANFGAPSKPALGMAGKAKVKDSAEERAKAAALDKKKKKKKGVRDSISSIDIDRAIKETLAEMEDTGASNRTKIKQKKKLEREEKEQKLQEEQLLESKRLQLTEFVTTSDLAALINTSPSDIIMRCMKLGIMVTINQRLDKDIITLLADDFGFEVVFVEDTIDNELEDVEDDEKDLKGRPAIVTIMGHVDHGKTSLLDYIRKTKVTFGESGGITQHIGAYKVNLNDKSITFLDTPGHEAFTAMRARGAQITDIVVLVVAADDMVMPQTVEAISHAKAANVPIIVAINKIDKPEANPDKIKQQLSEHEVLVEEWGGKNQCIEISAKKGINIDVLLEKILLEAELMELKANPDRKARGVIIESNMDKGFGATATVVVQKGTLNIGDSFVAGVSSGKVRGMFDEKGEKVETAYPSQPVRVIGFDGLPSAGDTFISVSKESEARKIASERKQLKREQELRQFRHITLEDFSSKAGIGDVKDLRLIVKADVDGSAEALIDSLQKLSTSEVRVNILHKAVGPINESDVMLAVASGAIIVGFHNSVIPKAQKLADDENVEIRHYEIIYDCIADIKNAMEGLLTPDLVEEITGNVEVRALFKNSKVGNIAGCYVLDGKISRNDKIKVLRDGLIVHTGSLQSLKREKDDVKEVDTSYECGILVKDFNDIRINDIIQAYKLTEVKRKLK